MMSMLRIPPPTHRDGEFTEDRFHPGSLGNDFPCRETAVVRFRFEHDAPVFSLALFPAGWSGYGFFLGIAFDRSLLVR